MPSWDQIPRWDRFPCPQQPGEDRLVPCERDWGTAYSLWNIRQYFVLNSQFLVSQATHNPLPPILFD